MSTIVFRADAGGKTGTGHLMRCLALAQAWRDAGGRAVFVTACGNEKLVGRLVAEGIEAQRLESPYPDTGDWKATEKTLAQNRADWLVLDGYHFGADYQRAAKEVGYRLLVIDDTAHLDHYYADIILNQNLAAEKLAYGCEPYSRLLLGTGYVLLRQEFRECRRGRRIKDKVQRILVTMGGSDPDNVTLAVLKSLQGMDLAGLELGVVIGADNPHTDEIERAAGEGSITLDIVKGAGNMAQLMAEADMAVSAAGSTVWELAYMGLPAVLVASSPVEEAAAGFMRQYLPFPLLSCKDSLFASHLMSEVRRLVADSGIRRNMSMQAQNLVDGRGAEWVIAEIKKI